jgi:hypothetical protein
LISVKGTGNVIAKPVVIRRGTASNKVHVVKIPNHLKMASMTLQDEDFLGGGGGYKSGMNSLYKLRGPGIGKRDTELYMVKLEESTF